MVVYAEVARVSQIDGYLGPKCHSSSALLNRRAMGPEKKRKGEKRKRNEGKKEQRGKKPTPPK